MSDLGQNLLLTSLTDFYNKNPKFKLTLKEIIEGKHKLSLRIIEWLVTHYAKSHNIYYWVDEDKNIYNILPDNIKGNVKKINLYQDYRAQLKSYSKFNFDSFRRHHRITFFINMERKDYIETTIGQLNFFRWIFNNSIINYAIVEPVIDWKSYLRRFNSMSTMVYTKKTRRKPNRRFGTGPALKIKQKKRTLVAIDVYGAKTLLGSRTMVWRLHSSRSFFLIRVLMPSPNSVPSGNTTAARPPSLSKSITRIRKRSAVSRVRNSDGKLFSIPFSSVPPNGGFVMMMST